MSDENVRLNIPPEIELIEGPHGLLLRGPALALAVALAELRRLSDLSEGSTLVVGDWSLRVSEDLPQTRERRVISMPGSAWNVAASVLTDAVFRNYGESKAMNFRDVGYLNPPADPDIGVDVIGDFAQGAFATVDDLRRAYEANRDAE